MRRRQGHVTVLIVEGERFIAPPAALPSRSFRGPLIGMVTVVADYCWPPARVLHARDVDPGAVVITPRVITVTGSIAAGAGRSSRRRHGGGAPA